MVATPITSTGSSGLFGWVIGWTVEEARTAHFKMSDEAEDCVPPWDSLPIAVLTHIFDFLLRAPTPHPTYLPGKLASWSSLFRTCHHWRAAIMETGVGVCLPSTIDARLEAWLKKVSQASQAE